MEWVLNPNIRHQRYFEEMTRIPHGSYHEKPYGEYLVEFAKNHGFEYINDEIGNVVIYKPASKGYENHPKLALQAHMDMVWVKDDGVEHDFHTEPLSIYIDNGFLTARGTTLGADNGTGVAYMLAILDDENAKHPALEAVFTVQEEVGMGGALVLDPNAITAKNFISLDCGGGDSIYISSVGGYKGELTKSISYEAYTGTAYKLYINGLIGGYTSGYMEEHRNANELSARIIYNVSKKIPLRLVEIDGGKEDAKIATSSKITFTSTASAEDIKSAIDTEFTLVHREISPIEKEFNYKLKTIETDMHMTEDDSADVLKFMYLMPCGKLHSHARFSEIMSECVNFALAHTDDENAIFTFGLRGSSDGIIENACTKVVTLAETFGFENKELNSFPAWEFHDSHLLKTLQKVYKEVEGEEIGLIPVQGGLECGVFSKRYPDMDIIAMGPFGFDVHTTKERLDLANFDSLYVVFEKLLASL